MTEDNEKLVRAFYEATVPGDRESLSALQSYTSFARCRRDVHWRRGMMDRSSIFARVLRALVSTLSRRSLSRWTSASSRSVISKEKRKGVPRQSMCPSSTSGQSG